MEYVIYDINKPSYFYDLALNEEEILPKLANANRSLKESRKKYQSYIKKFPDNKEYWLSQLEAVNNRVYSYIEYEEYRERKSEFLCSGTLEEIEEDTFNEMFDILPPLRWGTYANGRFEQFFMREMYDGSVTAQYAKDRKTGKFYRKMADLRNNDTWIAETIIEAENRRGA